MFRLVIGCLAVIAVAQGADRAAVFHWKGKLAPGLAVEIVGINGDVRAEYSEGTEVEILAATGDGVDNQVNVALVEHANGVTACAQFPKEANAEGARCSFPNATSANGSAPAGSDDRRVNFTVRVPRGVNLISRTVNGQVEANHLESNVQARTVNGQIRISTTRSAQAQTVNGSITASLQRPGNCLDSSFSTVNGSITVLMPKRASARLLAETVNGKVRSDFPLVGSRKGTKRLAGRIGGGSSNLKLKTVNGSIQLKRSAEI
jgi:hypothetical protein